MLPYLVGTDSNNRKVLAYKRKEVWKEEKKPNWGGENFSCFTVLPEPINKEQMQAAGVLIL